MLKLIELQYNWGIEGEKKLASCLPYYDFMNSVQECYSQIHQTGSPSNQACDQQKIEILQQYKDLNMDVINGKNFSYEQLKSHRI